MRRFRLTFAAFLALLLAMSTVGVVVAQGQGNGNSARSVAEPATITSVEAEVSNPAAANFEEEFTYYVVRFDPIDHVHWTYREPARLGGSNTSVAWAGTSNAFWFGVTAPDSQGIQHNFDHKGQVSMYYETADGDVYSIIAQFNGKGELISVNGVKFDG
jgi:hypothetical protein